MINYEDFSKIELKTAKILFAERVEGSDKLIRMELDAGEYKEEDEEKVLEKRQIVAGIGKKYEVDELIGKTIIIVSNLEPRKLMGIESQGMLLAASNDEGELSLLTTIEDISTGSDIK